MTEAAIVFLQNVIDVGRRVAGGRWSPMVGRVAGQDRPAAITLPVGNHHRLMTLASASAAAAPLGDTAIHH